MRILSGVLLAITLTCAPAHGGATAASVQALPFSAVSPPLVTVVVDAKLAATASSVYGRNEVEVQAQRLRRLVAEDLQRMGVMAGGRVELVLTDIRPSRPTVHQLRHRPGLSFRSSALGARR